jgi:hypothetical protein
VVEWHGWHAFRRGLGSNLNDLGVLDLTIQKILRHSNVTTTRKSYIHHREHQVTAAMEQLAAGIEAESRRAEAERLAANESAETSTGAGFGGRFLSKPNEHKNVRTLCQRW